MYDTGEGRTLFIFSFALDRVYDISTDVLEAAPFHGVPVCLPGTIEAEAFDTGGLGLGFGETEPE